MSSIKQIFDLSLGHCPSCGWIFIGSWNLCHFCENMLKNSIDRSATKRVVVHNIQISPLVFWNDDNNGICLASVLDFKGGNQKTAKIWVEYFIKKNYQAIIKDKNTIVIPVPSKRKQFEGENEQDHSFLLAKELAAVTGCKFLNPLRHKQNKSQKKLNAKERAKIEVELNENFTKKMFRNTNVILIDDVVTTGSTMRACFRALGGPSRFEAWTMFYREGLRQDREFDRKLDT